MSELKFAFRRLLKSPGFAIVSVLTLALGIGVNTSMFSPLQALLARPLPYPDAGQLVQVFQTSPHWRHEPHHSPANFLDSRTQDSDFAFIAALNDPMTFVLAAVSLGAVAFAACLIPTRRPARVDPIIALRAE
jgi:ABC-type antimicrobial peptide transport system permease subunit